MVSENQQQEFELLTDDDDWSDSPKAGKKNSLWNTNAVVVKSNDLLTAKTNLTLNELRIILVAISKIDSMNPEVRGDRKSTRLNSSHTRPSRMPSSA